jgi:hypothetical protein
MLDPDPDEMNADPQPCQKVRLSKRGAAMVRAGGEGTVQAAAARGSTVALLLLLNGVEEQLVSVLELRSATVTPKRLTSYVTSFAVQNYSVTNRMQH